MSAFRTVQSLLDLCPRPDASALTRRLSADGVYLSVCPFSFSMSFFSSSQPLRQLSTHLIETYRICNPSFSYLTAHNPRRVLTKPSKAAHSDGYDNEDYDYILYVNDCLGSDDAHKSSLSPSFALNPSLFSLGISSLTFSARAPLVRSSNARTSEHMKSSPSRSSRTNLPTSTSP